jgi:excisionase family DNA binding protein
MELEREHDDRPLLTPAQASERLNISPRTLRDMFRTGALASVKIEGCRRVEPAAIDEYLVAHRQQKEVA